MGYFSLIVGAVTGLAGPISQVINRRTDLKMAQVKSDSDIQKAEIGRQMNEVDAKEAVLIAEAKDRLLGVFNAIGRASIAIPVAVILNKILIWDMVVGAFYGCAVAGASKIAACNSFVTPLKDPNLWWVVLGVVGFYFLTSKKER